MGQPPSVVRGSEARDLPANRVELRSSETAEGGCSPWPLVAPQSNSRLSLSATPGGRQPVPWAALGLCCRNCHRCIRLAATALVGGGMDRLCIVRRVPAPAAWPAGIHRRIGCPAVLGCAHGSSAGPEGRGQVQLDAICRRHRRLWPTPPMKELYKRAVEGAATFYLDGTTVVPSLAPAEVH